MAERPSGGDLDRALAELSRHIAYPATPDLARQVRASLASAPAPQRRGWARLLAGPSRRALTFGLLAAVVVAAAVLAVWPQARTTVAERLGVGGVRIVQVPALPTATQTLTGSGLDLGEPSTLEAARGVLPLLLPTLPEIGPPDTVYLAAGGRVSLVYGARTGLPVATETGVSLLLIEARAPGGSLSSGVLGKTAGPGTRVEEVSVNAGRGVWLEGAPHLLFLPDAAGRLREDQVRLAGNVLLWEQDGLLLRLEGGLSRDEALRIAASVR